jgi:hypothetical protein
LRTSLVSFSPNGIGWSMLVMKSRNDRRAVIKPFLSQQGAAMLGTERRSHHGERLRGHGRSLKHSDGDDCTASVTERQLALAHTAAAKSLDMSLRAQRSNLHLAPRGSMVLWYDRWGLPRRQERAPRNDNAIALRPRRFALDTIEQMC